MSTGTSSSGGLYIRGIDIDKAIKGFADEEFIMKKFCNSSTTGAREIRWYQKPAGVLTGTSPAGVDNVAQLALPYVLEQSWTRKTSYIRKYFVESPYISIEDIKDSDPDVIAGNLRDLVRAVSYQVNSRIWDVVTESRSPSLINNITSTAAWDAVSGQNPILDLMKAKTAIRTYNYDPEGAVLLLSPKDHESLLNWLISVKGSSIPSFSSARIGDGTVMEILGLRVVVNTFITADYACVMVPQRAATWKSFLGLNSAQITDEGIGVKIRVWEEGEAILTDPKAVSLISNTQL